LRCFEDHVLWHKTVSVDGEEQQEPVTLLHLGLALLFAAGTWVLLKRLPALLEIVLLRRYKRCPPRTVYAVTTLTSYVIGATGILLVLGTLGASWTQLQWMAAALSVGIGFGLQEIVANFISGLIILFERPIRVGDTVTVGDTDGVVTKIRIRATTIRNFDRKELLVPNKEFITGRLLNWSLSDPVTRIVLVVGVAYGSDVERASAIMKRIAEANEHVLDEPPPVVTFDTFGDNALTLTLRAYVDSVDVRIEHHLGAEPGHQPGLRRRGHQHRLPAAGPASGYDPTAADRAARVSDDVRGASPRGPTDRMTAGDAP
jgi:potassium efflux system protein